MTSTPFTPRLDSRASYTSRFSFSVTVTLSMILRLPRSRIDGLDFLGFVGPDVVLGQDLFDRLQAILDDASSFEAQCVPSRYSST